MAAAGSQSMTPQIGDDEMTTEQKIDFKAPGGWGFSASGGQLIQFLLGLIFVGGMLVGMFMLYKQTEKEHDELKQGIDNMTYVLYLPPEERKQLNLRMPKSLREMTRRDP
jgi:hypothetical protein